MEYIELKKLILDELLKLPIEEQCNLFNEHSLDFKAYSIKNNLQDILAELKTDNIVMELQELYLDSNSKLLFVHPCNLGAVFCEDLFSSDINDTVILDIFLDNVTLPTGYKKLDELLKQYLPLYKIHQQILEDSIL